MKNLGVKFAVIAFIITVVWTMTEHFAGYNTTNHALGQYTRMITGFIFYFFIVWAIVQRKKFQDNKINLAEGFRTGLIVCCTYAVLSTLWFALYAEVINPQFKPSLIAFEKSKLDAIHASPEAITEKLNEVELTSGGSFTSYIFLFGFTALMGVVIAFLAAMVMRNKKSTE